MKNIC